MEKCLKCGAAKEVRSFLVSAKFKPYEKETEADVCINCSDISLHRIEAFALMKASLFQDELDEDSFSVLYQMLLYTSFETYFVVDNKHKAISPAYLAEKIGVTLESFDLCLERLWSRRLVLKIMICGDPLFLINASKFGFEDEESFRRKNLFAHDFTAKRSKEKEASRRRLMRIKALVDDFSVEDKLEIFREFGGKCALTGKEVALQMDHVIPVAIGHGGTTKSNMLPIWQRINSSKSDGTKKVAKDSVFVRKDLNRRLNIWQN